MNKKEVAKTLFLNGKTLKNIAELIGENYETVKKWSTRSKWKNLQGTNDKRDTKKGRKDKYYTHVKPKFNYIKELIQEGFTEKEISKRLKIAYSTFNEYKKNKSEFSELLKNARVEYGSQIEEYLFKIASGREFEQVINKDKNGEIIPDKKTGIEIQDKKNTNTNLSAAIKVLQRLYPEQYNPFLQVAREKLEHQKKMDKEKFEHQKKIDEQQLKLLEEKINTLKNDDDNSEIQHQRIVEYIKATRGIKDE
jgi:DNA-binding CsgD family transcriptional regulator